MFNKPNLQGRISNNIYNVQKMSETLADFFIDWFLLDFLCYRQDFQMTNLSICPGAVCQQWANHNSLRSFETNYQKK